MNRSKCEPRPRSVPSRGAPSKESRPGRGLLRLAAAHAALLTALLAPAAAGCGRSPDRSPETAPKDGAGPAQPNLVVVVVDTLGAEHVGAWAGQVPASPPGRPPATTPHLDALARRGVRFRHAYSPAPWTQPAIASLLTGRMPSEHGLVRLFDTVDAELPWVPALLVERGWDTAGVVSHKLVGRRYGFARGFGHWDESAAGGHRPITSREVTDAALAWLDGRREREGPFFLFVHYFDPHYVYRHHPDHDRTAGYAGPLVEGMGIWTLRDRRPELTAADVGFLTGLYREEIAFTDAQIGRLLAGLADRGLGEDTAIVVTADHGEELMRHGWIGHTRTLYDELLHVPLIVVPAAGTAAPAPRAVDAPVSLIDLAPTLLELAGVPAGSLDRPAARRASSAEVPRGRSLLPLLAGGDAAATAGVVTGDGAAGRALLAEVSFAVSGDEDFKAEKNAFQVAAFDARYKAVHDLTADRWSLFDRRSDPEELAPLASSSDPALERLVRRVRRFETARRALTAGGERLVPDAEEIERLRSLGYLR